MAKWPKYHDSRSKSVTKLFQGLRHYEGLSSAVGKKNIIVVNKAVLG
jgi:hypothetical protein